MAHHCTASLRLRFLIALAGVFLLAVITLGLLTKLVFFPALYREEQSIIVNEMDRLERSVIVNKQQLLAQARDWATWDDTYEFVQGNYPRYAEVNFSQSMFEEMRYKLMAFFNADGEVHFLGGLNPTTGQYQTCETATQACSWMMPYVVSMQRFIQEDSDKEHNVLYTHPSPTMVASSPILRTDSSGPPTGWLFKVRAMNSDWLSVLSELTGMPLSLTVRTVSSLPESRTTSTIMGNTVLAERYLAAYQPGATIAISSRLQRDRYLAGLRSLRYVLIWTGVMMFLVIVAVLVLLQHMILTPLRKLTRLTQQLDTQPAFQHELSSRNDEIGLLARTFEHQFTHQRQLNEKLSVLSTHDTLTGLPNRRLFDQELQRAVEQAIANNTSVAVMMLDIDHFKLFNDNYGHPKGDHCLTTVGKKLQELAERHDVVIARTGGEEFSVLAEMPVGEAHRLANTITMAIDALNYPHAFSPVSPHVTFSIGISSLNVNDGLTASALMSTADQALYEAKKAGRHQVRLYAPPLAKETISTHNTPP
ncbi:diguanylate cyclase [Halomonas sp. 7T]|uniref:sensor domain-containing diguanylate cyclase n=1 Tax=Halomonas sp. 7T TaxID=2893469 RepID=UPI0021D9F79B|nr:diguanylate cyclase [Halomonas sp. 7T]UXZ55492.1 diguanylate cyclase [Halomonas sp. 7T]